MRWERLWKRYDFLISSHSPATSSYLFVGAEAWKVSKPLTQNQSHVRFLPVKSLYSLALAMRPISLLPTLLPTFVQVLLRMPHAYFQTPGVKQLLRLLLCTRVLVLL